MVIIIDAYNLLKQLFSKNSATTDAQTKFLLSRLQYYKNSKEKSIKDIILVFDAGPFGHATREVKQGIVIMHAGQKSSADDWIIGYVHKNKQEEITVVSADRKLVEACAGNHVFSMPPLEFYKIVSTLYGQREGEPEDGVISETGLRKFAPSDRLSGDLEGIEEASGSLDRLLEEHSGLGTREMNKDEASRSSERDRKQVSRSKEEKKIEKKIKKLW